MISVSARYARRTSFHEPIDPRGTDVPRSRSRPKQSAVLYRFNFNVQEWLRAQSLFFMHQRGSYMSDCYVDYLWSEFERTRLSVQSAEPTAIFLLLFYSKDLSFPVIDFSDEDEFGTIEELIFFSTESSWILAKIFEYLIPVLFSFFQSLQKAIFDHPALPPSCHSEYLTASGCVLRRDSVLRASELMLRKEPLPRSE